MAFQVKGHAGHGSYGTDIVCAAVSALTQAAVIGLEEYLELQPVVRIEEGFLNCRLPTLPEARRDQVAAILETMVLGLRAIARDYPKRIYISEKEV